MWTQLKLAAAASHCCPCWAKLQNTGPLNYISMSHKSAYCVILRSSKDFDTCKTGGPKWPCILFCSHWWFLVELFDMLKKHTLGRHVTKTSSREKARLRV